VIAVFGIACYDVQSMITFTTHLAQLHNLPLSNFEIRLLAENALHLVQQRPTAAQFWRPV
jgi:hypothetical protein